MTTREDIAKRATEVIGSHFEDFEGEPSEEVSIRNDLNVDSLDEMEIIMDLEDEFQITLEDEFFDMSGVSTIGNVIDQLFEIINR